MCNKTKPLDLTKPVQTRDGRSARIVCTNRAHPTHPVLALVLELGGQETTYGYTLDGKHTYKGTEFVVDLVNVPNKKSRRVLLLRERTAPYTAIVRAIDTYDSWSPVNQAYYEILAEHTFEWEE